ncbi:site-specific tyrosine recombinase/integron integrase [Gelidibacter mesophilus]|uniref:site-specific tyrosine recombinase/integron integrase n=1 Tax=Gelidibacter mesophilus TaxID=169050 RepID=UPI00041A193F|nr:site-specific tyrosine recombinase/integron integrase [Gelidibacter mesophilus]
MNRLPHIKLAKVHYDKQRYIAVTFDYHSQLIATIRKIPTAKWSSSKKQWHVEDSQEHYLLILNLFKNQAFIDDMDYKKGNIKNVPNQPFKRERNLTDVQKHLLNNFYKYLKGKRYSQSTINTYVFYVADFIEFCTDKVPSELKNRDVELFIESVFIARNYSISTQRQFISALKLFILFEPSTQIENLELERPQRSKHLPNILSQREIVALLSHTKNLKHRAIIALLYSSGLRISELINLKISDISIDRRQVFVKNGKGRKDRYITLAESMLPLLHQYLKFYKPQVYFTEGLPGEQYSASSIRKFLKTSAALSGISISITPHTLRHSYATHLIEQGVGIRHIQELLGHSKPETTMIYTHIAKKDLLNIKSPLDYALEQLGQHL